MRLGSVARETNPRALRAAIEKLGQRPRTLIGLKPVLLLDPDPWQLAALTCELIPHPRVLLLAAQQLLARRLPRIPSAGLTAARIATTTARNYLSNATFKPQRAIPTTPAESTAKADWL
jgi:hypothetical protein